MTILGENSIVIVLGSNALMSSNFVDSATNMIKNASILLCQFEVPQEITLHALKIHKGHGQLPFVMFYSSMKHTH